MRREIAAILVDLWKGQATVFYQIQHAGILKGFKPCIRGKTVWKFVDIEKWKI